MESQLKETNQSSAGDSTGSYKTKPCPCPKCGYNLDRATSVEFKDFHAPKNGDLTMCMKCGEMLMYNEDVLIVPLPQDVFDELDVETKTKLLKMQRLARA